MTQGVRKLCDELETADGQRIDELICDGILLIGAIGGLGVSADAIVEAYKKAKARDARTNEDRQAKTDSP